MEELIGPCPTCGTSHVEITKTGWLVDCLDCPFDHWAATKHEAEDMALAHIPVCNHAHEPAVT